MNCLLYKLIYPTLLKQLQLLQPIEIHRSSKNLVTCRFKEPIGHLQTQSSISETLKFIVVLFKFRRFRGFKGA